MTETELLDQLCPLSRTRVFATDVAERSMVRQVMGELKLEHRIWPEKGKYRITSKGRVSHG